MEILARWLEELKPGTPTSFGGLTMVPLSGPGGSGPAYLTLDEALAAGAARVTEVGEAGHVPELRFVNLGDRPVLLIDGEELTGAKQNRILNLTILAPAGKELVIPVSCVEAGRWAGAGDFQAAPHVMYSVGRAEKAGHVSVSMRTRGTRASDQGQVWSSIGRLSEREGVWSRTSRLEDVYLARGARIGDYVARFRALENQVGAVFALGGRIRGIEAFDRPETLRKVLPKLIRSWAMDALAVRDEREPGAEDAARKLGELSDLPTTAHDAVGLGSELRFDGPGVAGGALVYDEHVLHLCAFWLDEGAGSNESPGWMISASRRARRRS